MLEGLYLIRHDPVPRRCFREAHSGGILTAEEDTEDSPRKAMDRRLLRLWEEGATGFPLVYAGMRQLASEGWMPRRTGCSRAPASWRAWGSSGGRGWITSRTVSGVTPVPPVFVMAVLFPWQSDPWHGQHNALSYCIIQNKYNTIP